MVAHDDDHEQPAISVLAEGDGLQTLKALDLFIIYGRAINLPARPPSSPIKIRACSIANHRHFRPDSLNWAGTPLT